jgi:tetrahydromethanopterin S-methyltransferase subunit H
MSADLVNRLKEAASERHGQGSGTPRWDPNSDEEKLLDEAAQALEAALSERDAAVAALSITIDGAGKIAKEEMDILSEKLKVAFTAVVATVQAKLEASEARVTALEKALAELLDIRPGVTEPLVAKAAWMRAVALSAKGGETP